MRAELPAARAALTFDFWARGIPYTASVGLYPDGRVGEVFVNGEKRDTASDHDGRDIAILISFALQHGAAPRDLARAMPRDGEGRAQGLAGILLDEVLTMLADMGRGA